MTDLTSLQERIGKATGADRELDASLFAILLLGHHAPIPANGVPAYTASLDAALSLVERKLPGWARQTEDWPPATEKPDKYANDETPKRPARPTVVLIECGADGWSISSARRFKGDGATSALALLAALLDALAALPPETGASE